MTDSRAVLDEIRDRVHRMVTPDGVHAAPDRYLTDAERLAGNWDCIANIAGDLTRLGAALRAVLDRHKAVTVSSFRWPESMGVVNRCEACGHPWPCTDYRAITAALGAAS